MDRQERSFNTGTNNLVRLTGDLPGKILRLQKNASAPVLTTSFKSHFPLVENSIKHLGAGHHLLSNLHKKRANVD